MVSVESGVGFVGGTASAFLSGADGCADFAEEVAIVVTSPTVLAGDVAVGVALLAIAGVASPADLAEVVAVDVISLADVGMVTVGVADLADAEMVTVGVTDLADTGAAPIADAGMAFPANPAGVVTIGVTSLAYAGMAFPADPAGVVTVGVASLADAGMITVGVTDVADTAPVDSAGVLKYGGGVNISCGDRLSPGVWCQNDLNSQFVNSVRCDPVGMSYTVSSDGSTGPFGTWLSGLMCPVTDYMTYWERLEALGAAVMAMMRKLTVNLAS